MAANFELKALVEDVASTERLIDKSQVLGVEALRQRDVYLPSQSHLVKLRYNDGEPSSIIAYQRAATPRGRPVSTRRSMSTARSWGGDCSQRWRRSMR